MNQAMRQMALRICAFGVSLIGLAYATAWLPGGAPRWGVAMMIVGAALTLAATLALGALGSSGRRGRILATAAFLFVVIVAGLGAPLLLPARGAGEPLLLGLPLRAALEVYGVGLLPMLVLPFVYAREFDPRELDPAALEAFRDECRRLRDADPPPGGQ